MPNNMILPVFILCTQLLFASCAEKHTPVDDSQTAIQPGTVAVYEGTDYVKCGYTDSKGNIWFGTTNEGVWLYNPNSGKKPAFRNLSMENGLSSNYVKAIIEDLNGQIWIGTTSGLCRYNPSQKGKSLFTHVPLPKSDKPDIWGEMCNADHVQCMTLDRHGMIWLGTCGGGAYRFDPSSTPSDPDFTNFLAEEGRKQKDSLHRNVINSIFEDNDGNLWFSSLTHGGVTRYDGKEFRHFGIAEGLKYDMVYAGFQDSKDNLWFGTIQNPDGGLFRYDPEVDKFIHYSESQGLCDNFNTGFYEDPKGKLWLTTGSVVCIFDPTLPYDSDAMFTPLNIDGNDFRDINFIIGDDDDNIWFGGKYGKLYRYDGVTLTDLTSKNI